MKTVPITSEKRVDPNLSAATARVARTGTKRGRQGMDEMGSVAEAAIGLNVLWWVPRGFGCEWVVAGGSCGR